MQWYLETPKLKEFDLKTTYPASSSLIRKESWQDSYVVSLYVFIFLVMFLNDIISCFANRANTFLKFGSCLNEFCQYFPKTSRVPRIVQMLPITNNITKYHVPTCKSNRL